MAACIDQAAGEGDIREQIVECDDDFHTGEAMMENLFRRYPHVDGMIVCNDLVAISTYKALHKRHIRVPQDAAQLFTKDHAQ